MEPRLNTLFLGPTRVHIPNGTSIASAVLTDRPMDRPRYSVCNNRQHLLSAAIQPNNNVTYNAHTVEEISYRRSA